MGGRSHGGVLPRGAVGLYRTEGAHTKTSQPIPPGRQGHSGEESKARPSVAAGLSKYEATDSEPGDHNATRWNAHLRFALTTGLRFSAHSNENTTTQPGDISIVDKTGTFLMWYDTVNSVP